MVLHVPRVHRQPSTQVPPVNPLTLTHIHTRSFSSCGHVHLEPLAHTSLNTLPGFFTHKQTGNGLGVVNYAGQSLVR